MKVRLLALVNVALVPYVLVRFPSDARRYVRGCWRALVFGETA